MDYKPFRIKRLPPNRERINLDVFAIEATGNPELIRTRESYKYSLITGFIGSSSEVEAQKLCDMLNRAWEAFHNGDETALFPVPKKSE